MFLMLITLFLCPHARKKEDKIQILSSQHFSCRGVEHENGPICARARDSTGFEHKDGPYCARAGLAGKQRVVTAGKRAHRTKKRSPGRRSAFA